VDNELERSDCALGMVLTRDVSGGTKEKHGKVWNSRRTFLIQVYSVTDTPAWLFSRMFCISVGIINGNTCI
jgi:hypothetical protein